MRTVEKKATYNHSIPKYKFYTKRFKSSQFREEIKDSFHNTRYLNTYIPDWKIWKWQATHNTRTTL